MLDPSSETIPGTRRLGPRVCMLGHTGLTPVSSQVLITTYRLSPVSPPGVPSPASRPSTP